MTRMNCIYAAMIRTISFSYSENESTYLKDRRVVISQQTHTF